MRSSQQLRARIVMVSHVLHLIAVHFFCSSEKDYADWLLYLEPNQIRKIGFRSDHTWSKPGLCCQLYVEIITSLS